MQRYQQSVATRRNPNDVAPITSQGARENMMGEGASTQIVASGGTLQRTQSEFFTAIKVQVPRDKRDVIRRVEEECELAPEDMMYSWKVKTKEGPKTVEGASIKLANTIASEYGNCITRARLVGETNTHWIFDGEFVDLERGVMQVRQFSQRKNQAAKAGRYDDDRALDIAFQIGQSKAIRNAVINGVGQAVISRAIKMVKKCLGKELIEESGGLNQAVHKMISTFKGLGVTEDQLKARVGKPFQQWNQEDLATMRSVYSALRDSETTVQNEFAAYVDDPPPPKDDEQDLDIPDFEDLEKPQTEEKPAEYHNPDDDLPV